MNLVPFVSPTRRRLVAHRLIQALGLLAAVFAVVAALLPWHEVRESDFGQGLVCAFTVDCHQPPAAPEAVLARPPDAVDSGLAHGGIYAILVLVVVVGLRVLCLLRPRAWQNGVVAVLTLAAAAWFALSLFELDHFFEIVTPLVGARLRDAAPVVLAAAALLDLAAIPFVLWRPAPRR